MVVYRDKVLDEAVNTCGSIDEYRGFWTNYKFADANLDNIFDYCMDKLCKREKNWDVKISEYIKDNYKSIPCFVDANHPSTYVMKEVGKQVANILGLNDIDDENYEFKFGICVPIMDEVLNHFNIRYVVPRKVAKSYLDKRVEREVDDYIKAYLWWYHEIVVN